MQIPCLGALAPVEKLFGHMQADRQQGLFRRPSHRPQTLGWGRGGTGG